MSICIREQSEWMAKWKNFKFSEFTCQCGCGITEVDPKLLDLLQEARDVLGPITITSAYRCPNHNSKVSKTGLSGPHTTGKSVDLHVSNSQHRKQLISYFADKVSGLGIAKTFIHIDILTRDDGFDARPNCWLY